MNVSADVMRKIVASLGRLPDRRVIAQALVDYEIYSVHILKRQLKDLRAQKNRDAELNEEIEAIRIAIAAREES